jgi:hypothetical protein
MAFEDDSMMDITRNQYFFAGLLVLLLGVEFRAIDSMDLTPKFTQFLAEHTNHPIAGASAVTQQVTQSDNPPVSKTIKPPDWIGWSLISLGSVLVLHSLAMKKPG